MKKKCFTALMLAAALTLTACGSNSADKASGAADQTQEADQTTEAEEPTEDEAEDASKTGDNKVTELAVDTPADINGQEFTLKTELAYPEEDDEIIAVTAVYGDQELKLDESLSVDGVYEVVLDGQEYVMAETSTYDDSGMIYVVKLDGDSLELTSTQGGHLGEMPADPAEGFPIESKIDVLGSYGGTKTYSITNDTLTAEGTVYLFEHASDVQLTVKASIPCRLEGSNATLNAGDVITPTSYSDDGTFSFELQDGTAGSLTVDLDEDGIFEGSIDGTPEFDLFEYLPYAG